MSVTSRPTMDDESGAEDDEKESPAGRNKGVLPPLPVSGKRTGSHSHSLTDPLAPSSSPTPYDDAEEGKEKAHSLIAVTSTSPQMIDSGPRSERAPVSPKRPPPFPETEKETVPPRGAETPTPELGGPSPEPGGKEEETGLRVPSLDKEENGTRPPSPNWRLRPLGVGVWAACVGLRLLTHGILITLLVMLADHLTEVKEFHTHSKNSSVLWISDNYKSYNRTDTEKKFGWEEDDMETQMETVVLRAVWEGTALLTTAVEVLALWKQRQSYTLYSVLWAAFQTTESLSWLGLGFGVVGAGGRDRRRQHFLDERTEKEMGVLFAAVLGIGGFKALLLILQIIILSICITVNPVPISMP